MARPYDEILKDIKKTNEEINTIQKRYRELCEELDASKHDKARRLFDKIGECIHEMNELGYNITACIELDGEEHWCEWDCSFTDLEMCSLG